MQYENYHFSNRLILILYYPLILKLIYSLLYSRIITKYDLAVLLDLDIDYPID